MAAFLKKRTRTQVVKLEKLIPIELRYETIVVEDGVLHIYRDVYGQNTNTEENLREVLKANGVEWNHLTEDERAQVQEALNAMSRWRKKQSTPKPVIPTSSDSANTMAAANERKAEAERQKKLRSQKEIVIESTALSGKGYPAPVNLDSGTGTVVSALTSPPTDKP